MTPADNVSETIAIFTHIRDGHCKHCDLTFDAGPEYFSETINHYIAKHGFRLFHVGTESSWVHETKLFHNTIAVLVR